VRQVEVSLEITNELCPRVIYSHQQQTDHHYKSISSQQLPSRGPVSHSCYTDCTTDGIPRLCHQKLVKMTKCHLFTGGSAELHQTETECSVVKQSL